METIDINQDFVITNLFYKHQKKLGVNPTNVKGLRRSLELVGGGKITEKSKYNIEGDRLMYLEYSKNNKRFLVVHGAFTSPTYGNEYGYRYDIKVYSNNPRTVQYGGGYGASGTIQIEHPILFMGGVNEYVWYNENIVSKVCEIIKINLTFPE